MLNSIQAIHQISSTTLLAKLTFSPEVSTGFPHNDICTHSEAIRSHHYPPSTYDSTLPESNSPPSRAKIELLHTHLTFAPRQAIISSRKQVESSALVEPQSELPDTPIRFGSRRAIGKLVFIFRYIHFSRTFSLSPSIRHFFRTYCLPWRIIEAIINPAGPKVSTQASIIIAVQPS